VSEAEAARGVAAVDALRRQFDRGFAAPARVAADDVEKLLALRVGGDAYAVRLADINGLLVEQAPAALPSAMPEFLGVCGLRGAVVPVWSLGALLGYGADREIPRWMILVGERGDGRTLALAFEHFEGHQRASRASFSELARDDADRPARRAHVRQSVRLDDGWRGVLDLEAIAHEVERRLGLEATKDATKTR
jgi:chemotaxis signal transduction protein